MKQLLTLCLAFALTGCAGKTEPRRPEPPQPVDGRCGIIQDVCLLGTPSGTGDTTPPYGWMCLGLHGGTDTPCSVPTARIEEDEVFAGQNALEEKVKAAGPLRGLYTIVDFTLRHPDCDPVHCHAHVMKRLVLDMGMPEENLRVLPFDGLFSIFSAGYDSTIRENTLVYNFPTNWAEVVLDVEVDILKQHNFLVVAALGNTEDGNRDRWYPDDPWWEEYGNWENAFTAFRTGKVLLAKYAMRSSDGTVVADEDTIKCGRAKEYCYSMIASPEDLYTGSSGASSRLGALTFYLFQLWDTQREVVGVLNTCAEDVGAPGIDEEFGRGVVSVVCDTVQRRERSAVSNSLNVLNASPVLSQMTVDDGRQLVPQSLSLPVSWLKPFYVLRGNDLETATGHLGSQFSLRGTDLFVSGGTSYRPLGLHSSLRYAVRTPFMEFGARRPLFSRRGHTVTLLGTYGHSEGNGLSAQVGHLGAKYGHRSSLGTFSLHALYRQLQGRLGIPGHREAGADLVPFTEGNLEVRVSFSVGR